MAEQGLEIGQQAAAIHHQCRLGQLRGIQRGTEVTEVGAVIGSPLTRAQQPAQTQRRSATDDQGSTLHCFAPGPNSPAR